MRRSPPNENIELIQKFDENKSGHDYVVGDIHGCFSVLEKLLEKVEFDTEKDRLFSVGDLVDRGPESNQFADYLAKPWFHAIRGNHEEMMITGLKYGNDHLWLMNGGFWSVNESPGEKEFFLRMVEELPYVIQVAVNGEQIGIVHADIWGNDWRDFLRLFLDRENHANFTTATNYATWSRSRINNYLGRNAGEEILEIDGIDHVYVGHTPVRKVISGGNISYIDTGACFGEQLTVVNLHTKTFTSVDSEV